MNLSEPFIRRPVMTVLVMVSILFVGINAYFSLPVSNMPDVNYPVIEVSVSYPGASPELMANNIASQLEKQFMQIQGITNITSNNVVGSSTIVLQFSIDTNINNAAQGVDAAINRATPYLPPDLPNNPTYQFVNPAETPIMYIALASKDVTKGELYTWGNTYIGQRLAMVNGVAQVQVYGSIYAVRVQIDPQKIAAIDMTLQDVSDALGSGNVFLPTGQLDGFYTAPIIQANGQLLNADQYNELIVAYRNDQPIRVKDIGVAIDSLSNNRIDVTYIDDDLSEPTVVVAIQTQPDANTVAVAAQIKEMLPGLVAKIPQNISVNMLYDKSIQIIESIDDVKHTLIEAFVLVVIVIFVYLGKPRDTLIPTVVLPMSIVGTFLVMYILGYTIDNLSMLALTLAIGFMIDDAIVVLENIVRHVEEGLSPWKAALVGSQQISFTILSMTLSLVAVFIPLLFMSGLMGMIFREFAVTLAVVTLISGFISLTLTPMLCSRFIPPREADDESAMHRFSERLNDRMLNWYKPKLQWILKHRQVALAAAGASIFCSYLMFKVLPLDFMPGDDMGFIIAYSQGEEGTSSERMKEYQDQINEILRNDPNVDSFVSVSAYPEYRQGVQFVHLKPIKERVSAEQVIQGLYPKLFQVPGVNTFLKNIPMIELSVGTQTKGAYQYVLSSLNDKELYASAKQLIAKMNEDELFQGVNSDMEQDSPILNIEIHRDKASTLGITAEQIENAFKLALSGNYVTRIQTPIDQYDVIEELTMPFQRDPAALNQIYLRSSTTQKLVPLSAVATWEEGIGANAINHTQQVPSVTINFNTPPGVPLGTAVARLKELAGQVVDESVSASVEGSAQSFEETMMHSAVLLLLAVFCIYIILGILYENFIHPVTILTTLPPAILGGLITLWIFGQPLSFYAYLGLILLIGIVKKNGIMIVDYALENIRKRGEDAEQSIHDACLVRFRPIMMTTVAAIAGAVPIAIGLGAGAEARRPLGLVIIGGLCFSQMITLFVTPVLYLYFEKLNEMFHVKSELE